MVTVIDKKILDEYVRLGKLKVNNHPTLPLFIYKYTPETEFKKDWDNITKMCRGLVIDDVGNIIARPFEKFFNIEDVGMENIPKLPYRIFEKLDGSLIEVFRYKGEVIIATMGSFQSDQVNSVKALWFNDCIGTLNEDNNRKIWRELHNNLSEHIKEGFTYLFEFVSPFNQIVVKYDKPELILLDVLVTDSSDGFGSNLASFLFRANTSIQKCPEIYFKDINEIIEDKKRSDFANKEGFVIKFSNGYRIKVKYDEYFRLHKIVSNIKERYVWEYLKDGKTILDFIQNVPDEFMQQIAEWEQSLQASFKAIEEEVGIIYHNHIETLKEGQPRKFYAQEIIKHPKKFHTILFNMFDGFNYDKFIWKLIEPKGSDNVKKEF